eukprot:TRINITY_DN113195_c0_g1_i1.p1 TRINITY_DN113195_c0_g1~~TRINITY_DN113195_c0_g1_i1.p1  ORF type:complete len:874 (-),score=121.68 TRINITY_DN113195_c0_g1_i1:242-2782(-)
MSNTDGAPQNTVHKRSGEYQEVSNQKLLATLKKLAQKTPVLSNVDCEKIVDTVVAGFIPGIETTKINRLSAESACYMATEHPEYSGIAGRIAVSDLHRQVPADFSRVITDLYEHINPRTQQTAPLVSEEVYKVATGESKQLIQKAINYDLDYQYDYFAFKTLERSYLLRLERKDRRDIWERPQQMLMRVSIGIWGSDIENVIRTYEHLSRGLFTHASPTLFNSGTPRPQLSSCFLIAMKGDSIEGIFDTLKTCAVISKSAGGIGLHCHNIRSTGSYIRGTNGQSNGLVPMLRVYNDTARYVDQGGGKRKGAFAIYLEPWHGDIYDFLQLRMNTGAEERRTRDLFLGLWIPDLFMKRVKANEKWTLMCPNEAPGLADVYGDEFEELYEKYEREGRGKKEIQAQDLWRAILKAQVETGTPYMVYKDTANKKSNQQNLGTIKCSNLCTEIIEYTDPGEVAVCNLASISLPSCVVYDSKGVASFSHEKLHEIARVATRNLNRIIDINYYPVDEARNSNLKHRPIGIGVQGLADIFLMLGYPFASDAAKELNKDVFETIYHGALEMSMELSKAQGPYATFHKGEGCPASRGELQFDLWGVAPSDRFKWDELKEQIKTHGLRNSQLIAPMPTASTSQILGNNECFEPFTSNIYVRRVLAGEFPVVNKHLVRDLQKLGKWNDDVRKQIIRGNGSVQEVEGIPEDLKERYKTVWEIRQRDIIDMAAARGAFIDQSASLNLFLPAPNFAQLTSMHFHAWEKGLKTGMYYLRTQPAVDPLKGLGVQMDMKKASQVLKENIDANVTVGEKMELKTESKDDRPLKQQKKNPSLIELLDSGDAVGAVCEMKEGCLVCGS